MERPFINEFWQKLAAKADSAWNDPNILQLILAELIFRKRAGARTLRKKLVDRLVELSKRSFLWPKTAILPSLEALGGDQFWYTEGILSFMGYRVGQYGVIASHRQDILDYVFHEQLPRVNNGDYMRSWGTPKSSNRLRKMAESLAAFARNAKRNRIADMSFAIMDWEHDLDYLKGTYYDGRFAPWPTSSCR